MTTTATALTTKVLLDYKQFLRLKDLAKSAGGGSGSSGRGGGARPLDDVEEKERRIMEEEPVEEPVSEETEKCLDSSFAETQDVADENLAHFGLQGVPSRFSGRARKLLDHLPFSKTPSLTTWYYDLDGVSYSLLQIKHLFRVAFSGTLRQSEGMQEEAFFKTIERRKLQKYVPNKKLMYQFIKAKPKKGWWYL